MDHPLSPPPEEALDGQGGDVQEVRSVNGKGKGKVTVMATVLQEEREQPEVTPPVNPSSKTPSSPPTNIPGNVHLLPDTTLQKLIDRHSAPTLIRQLSTDLAHRDAQITDARRRWEDRERALIRMLNEAGVGSVDVQRGLGRLLRRRSRESIFSEGEGCGGEYAESVSSLLVQAMSEPGVTEDGMSVHLIDEDGDDDWMSTPGRRTSITPRRAQRDSPQTSARKEEESPATTPVRPKAGVIRRFSQSIFGWDKPTADPLAVSEPPSTTTSTASSPQAVRVYSPRSNSVTAPGLTRTSSRSSSLFSAFGMPVQPPAPAPARRSTAPVVQGMPRPNMAATSKTPSLMSSPRAVLPPATTTVTTESTGATESAPPVFGLRKASEGGQSALERGQPLHFQAIAMAASMLSFTISSLGAPVKRNSSVRVKRWAEQLLSSLPAGTMERRDVEAKSPDAESEGAETMSLASETMEQMREIMVRNTAKMNTSPRKRASTLLNKPNAHITQPAGQGTHPGSWQPLKTDGGVQKSMSQTSLFSLTEHTVELDTIVPRDARPPTFVSEPREDRILTDRFGFIYDAKSQRSRKLSEVVDLSAEEERAAAAEERPVTPRTREGEDEDGAGEEEDVLKTPTHWTHFKQFEVKPRPVTQRVPNGLGLRKRRSQSLSAVGQSLRSSSAGALGAVPMRHPLRRTPTSLAPASSIPTAMSTVTAATQSSANVNGETSTARLLLSQLTDHDALQKAQREKWDAFFKKIRAERAALPDGPGGEQGELVGIAGLGLAGKEGKARWKEFRGLVMSGVPVVYRSKIWGECAGVHALRHPGYYEELLKDGVDGDAMACMQIDMDIYRTMPNNVYFGGKGPGVVKLRRVLLAFSRHNSVVGYCQGMNVIAATLLLTHATEEDAFWMLVAIVENILPENYFTPDLLASRADQRVLKGYVKQLCGRVHIHLRKLGVDLEAMTFNWFLSVFADCLSPELLFRIWDVLFLEGNSYLFRVAIALVRLNEKNLLQCRTPAAVYSFLKDMTTHVATSPDGLVKMSCEGIVVKEVTAKDVEKRRAVEIEELKREIEELSRLSD
ncbi:hypothetical protein YB2330_003665 [Saitoella coloradoensis]